MKRYFENSLLLRMGLAMSALLALAFVGMLSSVIIAGITQGAAAAINQAGSLRMQSYRIASSLRVENANTPQSSAARTAELMAEFEQRLLSQRLIGGIPSYEDEAIRIAYERIVSQWHERMRPLLLAYINTANVAPDVVSTVNPPPSGITASNAELREVFLDLVDNFVRDIDYLVGLLELQTESNIQLLRLIQVVSLVLTLVVVFVTMYLINTGVLLPLHDLLTCAAAAGRGDFSVRTSYQGDDELGRLAHAFNVMAEDLSKIYAELEGRVQRKTAALERSNQSLELLYNTSRWLNEAPLASATYTRLLHKIESIINVGASTICLAGYSADHAVTLATTRKQAQLSEDICSPQRCASCLGEDKTHFVDLPCGTGQPSRIISIPIADQEQRYGVLLMDIPAGGKLEKWQIRLLEAVAHHIALALNITQQATQSRRLALLEERSVIARELHDSLAQALSYMKIQVSRLDASLRKNEDEKQIQLIVQELREGISSAYRELRELLTTFRLKMDGRGLSSALDETVHDLQARGTVSIALNNHLQANVLTPNEEIHVLQVIREALSNVVAHANAQHVDVLLDYAGDNKIMVSIEDDGIGIPDEAERRHHYGLAIMNERTMGLGGNITISRRNQGGTRVELVFTPTGHSYQNIKASDAGHDYAQRDSAHAGD